MRYDPISSTHISREQALALGASPSMYDAVLVGGPWAGLTFQTSLSDAGSPGWPGMGYHHRGGTAWYRMNPDRPLDRKGRFVWHYTGTEFPPDRGPRRRRRVIDWARRVLAAAAGLLPSPGGVLLPA
jgi:hypothetical protein